MAALINVDVLLAEDDEPVCEDLKPANWSHFDQDELR